VGMRGAGKSSLAGAAAAALGESWKVIDLDQVLVEGEGRQVSEIVDGCGWPGFRAKEVDVLLSCLSDPALSRQCVISCGGGVVETPIARAILRAYACGGALMVRAVAEQAGLLKTLAEGAIESQVASVDPAEIARPGLEALGPKSSGLGAKHAIVCIARAIADIEVDLGLATSREHAVTAAGRSDAGGAGHRDQWRPGYSGGEGFRDVYARRQRLYAETASHLFAVRPNEPSWEMASKDFGAFVGNVQGCDVASGYPGSGLTLGAEVHASLLASSGSAETCSN